jgi:proteasome lid subunit RPN8/RPN11
MIQIRNAAWRTLLPHLVSAYPKEGCGLLLGTDGPAGRVALIAVPSPNAYDGEQKDRFLLEPKVQLSAEKLAREEGLDVIGIFHSHPDCDAYFSATDRENTWSFYSNLVVSIRAGAYADAACFRVDDERTRAIPEEFSIEETVKHG